MILQKKQLDHPSEVCDENKSFWNKESNKEDKCNKIQQQQVILIAPSKSQSKKPQVLQCDTYQCVMISKVESKPVLGSCLICFCSFFFRFFTFLYDNIKFMINKYYKDAQHYCQSCQNKLGTYYFIFE
ncbi:unnamed protein product [Paramecium sonneborni]|uniref:LITAF domain-containing protein n=1 Tax=Paramecium sonneborni TaxID=65129 RepID=A0A8S1LGL0_9CILI|nr:unnamed protein product [Paramecium sonneborni]